MASMEKKASESNITKKGEAVDTDADLSEEDLQLKNNLELLVERILEQDEGVKKLSLETVRKEIRSATTSMTSVPKPLKFLRPHYASLKSALERTTDDENRRSLADVISIMASTCAAENERDALKYRLLGSDDDIGSWGHEYIRNLTAELSAEFPSVTNDPEAAKPLLDLVEKIVPYHMSHNAEPEAVDLLIEVDQLDLLTKYVDENNYRRTCLYLTSCCQYLAEPDDHGVLVTAHGLYMGQKKHHDAMRVALRLNDMDIIEQTFNACEDTLEKSQLCYLLARQGVVLDLESGPCAIADEEIQASLREINSNSKLSEHFLELARDLDVMEPKEPKDVYKMHLVEGRTPSSRNADSARQNLASTFVNSFVNAGFGQDKLITVSSESESGQHHWIFRNREHGKTSATASLGMITMWDVDGGLTQIDKYLYLQDTDIVAGALLAIGMVNCCIQNENDPAYALIFEHVNHSETIVRIGAIIGLGLAYAGTCNLSVEELLLPLVTDPDVSIELAGFAALSLGLIFSGTCKAECAESICESLMVRPEAQLSTPHAKMMCLGIGMLFLGKQDRVEAAVDVAKTLNEVISKFCQTALEACAYAGTGNVLKVQEWLAACGEHIERDTEAPWKDWHQGMAVIGIALVAMTEELGSSMIHRTMEHLLLYCKSPVRAAVPLGIALLNVSNPEIYPMDILSRLSHDSDSDVAKNAVLALGILGAGTNNARLAGMLRNLSSYYYKDPAMLFLVKIAQGLVYMGKGLMTINPYHTDRQLLSNIALSGILCVLTACLDLKETIAGKYHYMLFYLTTAMKPRYLLTVDVEGKLLPVPVRVGQAVDTVAQAGRPKTITGFQTHNTPVLLAVGERAELATDKYIPLSPILESVVILKENPDYMEMSDS
eukprot:g9044.t1